MIFVIYKLFILVTSRHRNGRLSNNAALTPAFFLLITKNDNDEYTYTKNMIIDQILLIWNMS